MSYIENGWDKEITCREWVNEEEKIAFIEKTHTDAKKLFARLGLGFKKTPEHYEPSLWVIDKEGEIIGEILLETKYKYTHNKKKRQVLLETSQKWTSNNKINDAFIGGTIEEGTDCKELAALLEISASITALCVNEFTDTGGTRYA